MADTESKVGCPQKDGCALFTLIRVGGVNATWKIFYCDAKFSKCARYRCALDGKPIPSLLLPNGKWLKKAY